MREMSFLKIVLKIWKDSVHSTYRSVEYLAVYLLFCFLKSLLKMREMSF